MGSVHAVRRELPADEHVAAAASRRNLLPQRAALQRRVHTAPAGEFLPEHPPRSSGCLTVVPVLIVRRVATTQSDCIASTERRLTTNSRPKKSAPAHPPHSSAS